MGAGYRPQWSKACTHLVAANNQTDKFAIAEEDGAEIVVKEWIVSKVFENTTFILIVLPFCSINVETRKGVSKKMFIR